MRAPALLPELSCDSRAALDLPEPTGFWPCRDVADGAMKHVNAYFLVGLTIFLEDLTTRLKTPEQHGYAAFSAGFRADTMRKLLRGDFIPMNGSNERKLREASERLLGALVTLEQYFELAARETGSLTPETIT